MQLLSSCMKASSSDVPNGVMSVPNIASGILR